MIHEAKNVTAIPT